jgi:hypothetical protein
VTGNPVTWIVKVRVSKNARVMPSIRRNKINRVPFNIYKGVSEFFIARLKKSQELLTNRAKLLKATYGNNLYTCPVIVNKNL